MKYLPSFFSLLASLLFVAGFASLVLSLLSMPLPPPPLSGVLPGGTALGMSGWIALVLAVFCMQATSHYSTRLLERQRVLRATERERAQDRARSCYISEMLEQYPTLARVDQLQALPWYTLCAASAYCHYGHYACAQALVQVWEAAKHNEWLAEAGQEREEKMMVTVNFSLRENGAACVTAWTEYLNWQENPPFTIEPEMTDQPVPHIDLPAEASVAVRSGDEYATIKLINRVPTIIDGTLIVQLYRNGMPLSEEESKLGESR